MALITVDQQADAALRVSDPLANPVLNVSYAREAALHTKTLSYTNTTGGALAIGTVIDLGSINHCTILPTSRLENSAFGVGALLDLGLQEYKGPDGETVAADANTLVAGADVSVASTLGFSLGSGTSDTKLGGKQVTRQTSVLATVQGAVMPAAASMVLTLEFVPGN